MNLTTYRKNAADLVNLTDAEALTTIIKAFAPAANATETAAALLNAFGSLKNVIETSEESLKRHTTPATAAKLSALLPVIRLYRARESENAHQINDRTAFSRYCLSLQEGNRNEHFYLICVNSQCRVISTHLIAEGSLSEVAAYPRRIVEAALNANAHSVFLCHNHPGGTFAPSQEDIKTTLQLQRILAGLGILLLDHGIVAGGQVYSMKQHGDF